MPRPRDHAKEEVFFEMVAEGDSLAEASRAVGWSTSYGTRLMQREAKELGADRSIPRGNNDS